MLLSIFVIGLVTAMTLGILKRLSMRAEISAAVVCNERLFYVAEAGFAHAMATLKTDPGFTGRIRWNDSRTSIPGATGAHSYQVVVEPGPNGSSTATCQATWESHSRIQVRTLGRKTSS